VILHFDESRDPKGQGHDVFLVIVVVVVAVLKMKLVGVLRFSPIFAVF